MAFGGIEMLKSKLAGLATGAGMAALLVCPSVASAQSWKYVDPVPSGTTVQVRTTEMIDAQTIDGRIYKGVVENDVRDAQGQLAIPAGATAELVVRRDSDNDLVLDLDSVTVHGRRYGVDATRNRIGGGGVDVRNSGIGANKETARNVGGGAVLGAILGAVIGGGDGAAAGAAAGAAVGAGAQILTKGRRVSVPSEALLSYRLQSDLSLDVQDGGYDREGRHYHKYGTD
jgi:hypothetical protein